VSATLGIDDAVLERRDGAWTAREIAQQPHVWAEALDGAARSGLAAFVAAQLATPQLRILLTGAGTSAFIGESLAPAIARHTGARVDAVPTTDLVAGPARCFQREAPTLMLHFARSGNSPESVAALELADRFVDDCRHLVLTCNEDGALAASARGRPAASTRLLVLPAATNDRGFAMTSSFTSLLLCAARLFGLVDAAPAAAARDLLARGPALAQALVAGGFQRVVYLGSNELKGLARESALKLLELSDGGIVGLHDSPLGFRHGPKTIVDARTLVVLFVSNDAHARRYDLDLLRELRADGRAGRVLAVGAAAEGLAADDLLVAGLAGAPDIAAVAAFAVFAQVFALHQSLALGLAPDNPSVSGTVNRVVRGVTIHPFTGEENRDVPRD
jgi:tagatose-6-phosphate ketose/aldose isomerase